MNHFESLLMISMPGPLELVVILIIVLLVVGPKKLPELMRAVGKSISSFRQGVKEIDEDTKGSTKEEEKKKLD